MTSAKPKPPLIPGETRAYPVLPLRDIVVFPHMIVPLFVGRKKSIRALEEVMRSDMFILLAAQKNASDDDPATADIYDEKWIVADHECTCAHLGQGCEGRIQLAFGARMQ